MEFFFLAERNLLAERESDNHYPETHETHLKNSSAANWTDFKSDKSNLRKIALFPVSFFKSRIASSAFSLLLAATYTFALCVRSA